MSTHSIRNSKQTNLIHHIINIISNHLRSQCNKLDLLHCTKLAPVCPWLIVIQFLFNVSTAPNYWSSLHFINLSINQPETPNPMLHLFLAWRSKNKWLTTNYLNKRSHWNILPSWANTIHIWLQKKNNKQWFKTNYMHHNTDETSWYLIINSEIPFSA